MKRFTTLLFALCFVQCLNIGVVFGAEGDPVIEGKGVTYGINIESGAYLDDANVTDGNIPALQAAGAGFGDSPLWATDASTVTLKAATGQPAVLALSADAAEDNSDKWRVSVADGGDVTLETYQSGAWVVAATWTNAGGYTVTGALSASALTEGANAVPNATDPLSFFAATTSAQLAGVLSDETGTLKSVFSDSPEFTTKITTPAITAPAASLVIKPTLDATTAIQVQDKDGTVKLNVDTVNNRVGIGTAAPSDLLHIYGTGAANQHMCHEYVGDIGLPYYSFRYAREGKTLVTNGYSIGRLAFFGYDGAAYREVAEISTYIDTTSGAGDMPTRLHFSTTPDGSATSQVRLVIKNTGNVGIGTTTPDTRLHAELNDATTAAAKEVAQLTLTSTGTPAAGIGPALQFETETTDASPGNMEVVAQIDGIATVVTPAAEYGASVIKTMKAGAAATEDVRFTNYSMQQMSSDKTHGGYVTQVYSASSGALTGATDKIELNIPAGWVIKACQLHVKTAVVDDAGDDTWSSELNDGAQEEAISAGSAAAQNTNVNHFAHADAGYGGTLTDAETDILLTPNGGNFSSGEIEAHCLCFGFDTWDNE